MFIGQIGQAQTYSYTNNLGILSVRPDLLFALKQVPQPRYDQVEINIHNQQGNGAGIYQPNGNQMRAFESVSSMIAPDDERIIQVSSAYRISPPSEQSSFTEEEALMNQYMKQYRIEGYFDGDNFVLTSSEPVRLGLKSNVSKEELENFRNKLVENGLGTEIDWRGVSSDLASMDVRFDNIEYFEQKADYLASRYAVLKNRILTQFTGEKQETEMQKLEQIYTEAKEEMADSYAENIGGFYENLGQTGAADDMRDSVIAVIDGKADAYTSYLTQNDIYADITGLDKQWLKQDDGYMAAQLRESVSEMSSTMTQTVYGRVPYGEKDLAYAGVYAKEISQQLKRPEWDTFTVKGNDSDLGRHLAEQYNALGDQIENTGISDKLSNLLKDSFVPFIGMFMDALDERIDQNRVSVSKDPWKSGLIRTNYIDRESVYNAFYNAITVV